MNNELIKLFDKEFFLLKKKNQQLMSVCINIPALDIATFFKNIIQHNPQMLWLPPLDTKPEQNQWSFATAGISKYITANGTKRFSFIKTKAVKFYKKISSFQPDDAPTLRFWGGGTFLPDSKSNFVFFNSKDSKFFIPKWEYMNNNHKSFLRITLNQQEYETNNWKKELKSLKIKHRTTPTSSSSCSKSYKIKEPGTSWQSNVKKALKDIERNLIKKVVTARYSVVTSEQDFLQRDIIKNFDHEDGLCTKFSLFEKKGFFAGVSPEQLLTVFNNGYNMESDALAGSAIINQEQSQAQATCLLLNSQKEKDEFKYVVTQLQKQFKKLGFRLKTKPSLEIRSLQDMCHLHSKLQGQADARIHALDALELLHPTPAVCGTPRAAAINWLKKNEDWDRGWYCGPVGWFDQEGNGDFFVAIRSALIKKKKALVFAGCGIVSGSVPQMEYFETKAKQTAMLRVLGVK